MLIKDLYSEGKTVFSLEVFPPKKESSIESVVDVLETVTATQPSFVSVTYGASGKPETTKYSQMIVNMIKGQYDTEVLFHLTCINNSKAQVRDILKRLKKNDVHNVLALRGDISDGAFRENDDFKYALDLIKAVKEPGGFCVGAACYPEGHIEEADSDKNYRILKEKELAGADFFISQLFFENRHFLKFRDKARKIGVTRPLVAGIMPILSKSQINRMIFMCGVSLPGEIIRILYRYEGNQNDLRAAGIEYAFKQAEDLIAEGVDGIHLYTMNQPFIAVDGMKRLRGR